MKNVITNLSEELLPALKNADEIWVAVALMSTAGLNRLKKELPKHCTQHYLLGIDLPTDPRALWILYDESFKEKVSVRLYSKSNCYHPKLYLIRRGKSYRAFLGSANCTNGGFSNNVELTYFIPSRQDCISLLKWFNELFISSTILRKGFLRKYEAGYKKRKSKARESVKEAKEQKGELIKDYQVSLSKWERFINNLKKYKRNKNNYERVVSVRRTVVNRLRISLDYPDFSPLAIDLDTFFGIWELGHIISIPKPVIKRSIIRFSRLLNMLCDESLPVVWRYNKALSVAYKIRGVNEGLISKILTLHSPKEYCVKNSKTLKAFKKYGIELPRGLSKGDKYNAICKLMKEACRSAGIQNLAVLDDFLYYEGDGK